MALRQNQDAGAELEVLGDRGRERQRLQRVGNRDILAARNLAGRGIWIGRFVILRDDDVLDGPDRFDADLLGGCYKMREQIGIGEGTGIGEHQADFHSCLASAGLGQSSASAKRIGNGFSRASFSLEHRPIAAVLRDHYGTRKSWNVVFPRRDARGAIGGVRAKGRKARLPNPLDPRGGRPRTVSRMPPICSIRPVASISPPASPISMDAIR